VAVALILYYWWPYWWNRGVYILWKCSKYYRWHWPRCRAELGKATSIFRAMDRLWKFQDYCKGKKFNSSGNAVNFTHLYWTVGSYTNDVIYQQMPANDHM